MSLLLLSSSGGGKLVVQPGSSLHLGSSQRPAAARVCAVQGTQGTGKDVKKLLVPKLLLVPLAVCAVVATDVAWPGSVEAGILSGSRGWEAIELPPIPVPDAIKRITEKQRQKYADFDANSKSSPYIKELLKRSQEKAERHKQEIQDKYCERQAEWGVGDCSLAFSTPEEKEAFMEIMKKKRAAYDAADAATVDAATVDAATADAAAAAAATAAAPADAAATAAAPADAAATAAAAEQR